MGRRKGWRYRLKKIFSCESEANRKREKKSQNHDSSKWLEKQTSQDSDSRIPENTTTTTVPSNNPPIEEDVKLIEAENEQNRHAYSVALATAAAAEAAVAAAQAAAKVVRLTQSLGGSKTKEEIAAIKIQTAFRGYMARRALRALRGLVRLKTLVSGQSVKRQAVSTLKCMQTLCRMQYEVRTRRSRMSEHNLSLQRQIQQKQQKEKSRESIGENWDDSILSKDQVEENLRHKQEAGMRRERALAYAYSRQQPWRNNTSNPANQTFMDPNNPRWGWMWLERWIPNDKQQNSDQASSLKTSTTTRSVSTKGDNLSRTRPLTPQKQQGSRPQSRQSPSTPKSNKHRPPSPRTTNDSNSINSAQSERCHRYSIASSSMRDDESLYSCPPAVRNYMTPTESARAKSRLSSPMGSEKRAGTPDSKVSGSAKKRLSFSGTPVGPRRHSGPPRIDIGSVKDSDDNKA